MGKKHIYIYVSYWARSNAARALRARSRVEKVLKRWMASTTEEGTLLHELQSARDEEGNALSLAVGQLETCSFA